jgi:CheY-like chemotaxis protein
MNKINILILDDTNNQRREVVANLIPTEDLIDSKNRYDFIKSVFNVVEFSRPTEAEAYLMDAKKTKPDLIISDIRFEFADSPEDHGETRGVDFIKFVVTHFPLIPTIAVTFYGIDKILRQFRRELPHLSLENIYAVAREDAEFQIADIDNVEFGLPFLLKKIATAKLAQNKLNVEEKIELSRAIKANDFLSKSIQTRTENFEIQHLMVGWAKIEKSENQTLKLTFDENTNDVLRHIWAIYLLILLEK